MGLRTGLRAARSGRLAAACAQNLPKFLQYRRDLRLVNKTLGDGEVKVVLGTVLVRVAIAVRPIVVARDWLIIRVPVAAERDANRSRELIACRVLSCHARYPSVTHWNDGAVHIFSRAIPGVVVRWAVASAGGGVPVETLVAIREVGNVACHSGNIDL